MKRIIFSMAGGLAAILFAACGSHPTGAAGNGGWKSYSGDREVERRVDSVLKLMTLEEKIGQLTKL